MSEPALAGQAWHALVVGDVEGSEPAGYRRSAGTERGLRRRAELLHAVVEDLAVNGLVDFSVRRAAEAAGATHKVLLPHALHGTGSDFAELNNSRTSVRLPERNRYVPVGEVARRRLRLLAPRR